MTESIANTSLSEREWIDDNGSCLAIRCVIVNVSYECLFRESTIAPSLSCFFILQYCCLFFLLSQLGQRSSLIYFEDSLDNITYH